MLEMVQGIDKTLEVDTLLVRRLGRPVLHRAEFLAVDVLERLFVLGTASHARRAILFAVPHQACLPMQGATHHHKGEGA